MSQQGSASWEKASDQLLFPHQTPRRRIRRYEPTPHVSIFFPSLPSLIIRVRDEALECAGVSLCILWRSRAFNNIFLSSSFRRGETASSSQKKWMGMRVLRFENGCWRKLKYFCEIVNHYRRCNTYHDYKSNQTNSRIQLDVNLIPSRSHSSTVIYHVQQAYWSEADIQWSR